jgi:uncharacterized membrane protein YkvA (DUF1232 family)
MIGFSDDAAVLFMAMNALGPHIKHAHLERARAYLSSES